jgi:ATP-binding cassette subfamily C protein
MFSVGIFSGVINMLALTGSIYMLQVYDRVLTGRSIPTLVALSALALGLFLLQAVIEVVRVRVMTRLGARIERDLLQPVHDLVLRLPLAGRSPQEVMQPLRDMETIRGFTSGQGLLALVDLPWMPLYLAFVFLLHPLLGWVSLLGMIVLVCLALLTEIRLREPTKLANEASGRRYQIAEQTRRNVESIRAMGFGDRAAQRFFAVSRDFFAATERTGDVAGTLSTISRMIRMILQSAIIGLGAWLVLKGQMTAGAIIAASIVMGRALAPVELAIANWRTFVAARQARQRLAGLLHVLEQQIKPIDLPLPTQTLEAEGVAVAAPGQRQPIIRNARMKLKSGDVLAVLGPSGAGKSTLARALVGAWPVLAGSVRLDGAPFEQYPVAKIGRAVGYLPQDVELFQGTIADNIARLDPEPDEAAVIAAAQAANVHDLILRLPDGYKTVLGESGASLSTGQRQRVGLARALYGNPFLIVLDEPNAHLDSDGEQALIGAIRGVSARGGIVIVIAHRPAVLEAANLAALVIDGEMKAFGPRDEVLQALTQAKGSAKSANAAGAPAAAPVTPMGGPFQRARGDMGPRLASGSGPLARSTASPQRAPLDPKIVNPAEPGETS